MIDRLITVLLHQPLPIQRFQCQLMLLYSPIGRKLRMDGSHVGFVGDWRLDG